MRFETYRVADISTKYITKKDAELISDKNFPGHIASLDGLDGNMDDAPGEILVVPSNLYIFGETIEEYTRRGMSPQFIKIFKELHAEELEYVRFDADGGEVEGDEGEVEEYSW